ncbi:uncharacterized protein AB9X84_014780 [Acanthopagrus schlegelii]
MEKMICRILLLISLSCVCGTFVVNVTQTSYQAEENHNITLEWTFTTTVDTSPDSLFIICYLRTHHKFSVLFVLSGGVEVPESQDQQFVGRAQWDKDVLRDGRLRLHVSRLRTEDSGRYCCKVKRNNLLNSSDCWLNVSAEKDCPKPERQNTGTPERLNTAGGGRIGFYCGLGLTAAVVVVLVVCCISFIHCHSDEKKKSAQSPLEDLRKEFD